MFVSYTTCAIPSRQPLTFIKSSMRPMIQTYFIHHIHLDAEEWTGGRAGLLNTDHVAAVGVHKPFGPAGSSGSVENEDHVFGVYRLRRADRAGELDFIIYFALISAKYSKE